MDPNRDPQYNYPVVMIPTYETNAAPNSNNRSRSSGHAAAYPPSQASQALNYTPTSYYTAPHYQQPTQWQTQPQSAPVSTMYDPYANYHNGPGQPHQQRPPPNAFYASRQPYVNGSSNNSPRISTDQQWRTPYNQHQGLNKTQHQSYTEQQQQSYQSHGYGHYQQERQEMGQLSQNLYKQSQAQQERQQRPQQQQQSQQQQHQHQQHDRQQQRPTQQQHQHIKQEKSFDPFPAHVHTDSVPQKASGAQAIKFEQMPDFFEGETDLPVKSVYLTKPHHQQAPLPEPVVFPDETIDQRLLLLSLADEYVSEARRIAPEVANLTPTQIAASQYYDLIAAGLGCYETVLNNPAWNDSPRQEASIRLRLFALLHAETKHRTRLEDGLTKGISKCERNRLLDLKYSMEHLLVRILFESQPKAALKYLDRISKEAHAFNHFAWVYALNFLRIKLLTEQGGDYTSDPKALFASLRSIVDVATKRRDYAILTLSSVVEIMLHQRLKGAEYLSEIERALASARGHLMSSGQDATPQLEAMIYLVDLHSSLSPFDSKAALSKARALQGYFDQNVRKAKWPATGVLSIPLKATALEAQTLDTAGIFQTRSDNRTCLNFQWIDKMEAFALGYLLPSIQSLPDNARDAKTRTESLLREALRALEDDDSSQPKGDQVNAQNLRQISLRVRSRQYMRCHIYTYLAMACIARCAHSEAARYVNQMTSIRNALGKDKLQNLSPLIDFMRAMMYHQNGNLTRALQFYQSEELILDKSVRAYSPVRYELAILSALAIVLITHKPKHPSHQLAKQYWNSLQQHAFHMDENGPSAIDSALDLQLVAACSLVMASTQKHQGAAGTDQKNIMLTKKYLQHALRLARQHSNYLILTAATSYGYQMLFQGQIGERALSTAISAQQIADMSGSRVWQAATNGLASKAHEQAGDNAKAADSFDRGTATAAGLPRRIQETLSTPTT